MNGMKGNINVNAMQSKLNQNLKMATTKERMLHKLKQRKEKRREKGLINLKVAIQQKIYYYSKNTR